MIYINIPKGWTLDSTNFDSDVFVNNIPDDLKKIPLQELIKECLQNKKRFADSFTFDPEKTHHEAITVYFKRPPNSQELFIRYVPNRNGKLKSENISIVKGYDAQGIQFAHAVGLLWFRIPENQVRLAPERLAEIEQTSAEQKENRRHTGDSPFPT